MNLTGIKGKRRTAFSIFYRSEPIAKILLIQDFDAEGVADVPDPFRH